MSVAILKLEDETLIAFNLALVSRMTLDKKGLWFDIEGIDYSTDEGASRRLRLHSSTKGLTPSGQPKPFSIEAMFDKFCNM